MLLAMLGFMYVICQVEPFKQAPSQGFGALRKFIQISFRLYILRVKTSHGAWFTTA